MTEQNEGITQAEMIHRLPDGRAVNRIDYLTEAVSGRRAIHIGFVDSRCWQSHQDTDTWLHAHLHRVAESIVGLDLDAEGVAAARLQGFEAHAVDCSDRSAVAGIHLAPAEVAIAGEIIEHIDNSGGLLDALHELVEPGGRLVVTTPNASGLLNATAAALGGFEVNHPDHVTLYSCFTLSNLLSRHGWTVDEVATYVPVVHPTVGMGAKVRLLGAGARALLSVERVLGRWAGLSPPTGSSSVLADRRRQARPDREIPDSGRGPRGSRRPGVVPGGGPVARSDRDPDPRLRLLDGRILGRASPRSGLAVRARLCRRIGRVPGYSVATMGTGAGRRPARPAPR